MARKTWRVTLDGTPHIVEIEHGYWTARREITVDGRVVFVFRPRLFEDFTYWQTSTEHPFLVGDHPAAVRVLPGVLRYRLELIVDGRVVDEGRPALGLPPPDYARNRARDGSAGGWWRWVILALLLFGIPTIFLVGEVRYLIDGREAPGIVIERYETSGRYGPNSHLGYRFTSAEGRPRQGRQTVGRDVYEAHPVGTAVAVQYLRGDPDTSRVDREIEQRYEIIYLSLGDAALAMIAIPLFWRRMRGRTLAHVAATGTLTRGEVVFVEGRRSSGPEAWLVRYRYRDEAGVERQGATTVDREHAAHLRVGQNAQIRFDPARPGDSVWIG